MQKSRESNVGLEFEVTPAYAAADATPEVTLENKNEHCMPLIKNGYNLEKSTPFPQASIEIVTFPINAEDDASWISMRNILLGYQQLLETMTKKLETTETHNSAKSEWSLEITPESQNSAKETMQNDDNVLEIEVNLGNINDNINEKAADKITINPYNLFSLNTNKKPIVIEQNKDAENKSNLLSCHKF